MTNISDTIRQKNSADNKGAICFQGGFMWWWSRPIALGLASICPKKGVQSLTPYNIDKKITTNFLDPKIIPCRKSSPKRLSSFA